MLVQFQDVLLNLPKEGLELELGNRLKEIQVRYESYGQINAEKNNVILICTPLTMDAHAAGYYQLEDNKPGWWDGLIGKGKALDTNHFQVICTNVLGGCQGTTGPSSMNPKTQKPYGSLFPKITMKDIVSVQYLLLKQLGIKKLVAVIGGSMGGMQALEWSTRYPQMIQKCLCIAAGSSLSTQGLGFKVVSRQILENDPNYFNGDYYHENEKPKKGLALARMIGIITYLSRDLMQSKFGRNTHSTHLQQNQTNKQSFQNSFGTNFEVERYLNYNAEKFTERFDANSYLYLTYAMDVFDLVQNHGSLEKAFENSPVEFLFVTLSSDWLFPPKQSILLCEQLLKLKRRVSLVKLKSKYGHDGFLLESSSLEPIITNFIEPTETKIPTHYINHHFVHLVKLIDPKKHLLDIGCGDNSLIKQLKESQENSGYGIDIDTQNVVNSLKKGVPTIQSDVDKGLRMCDDHSFDYAVLSHTLETLKKPSEILFEMLRVAERGVIVFHNFGQFQYRLYLLLYGRMPKTKSLPHEWWNTPNIHLFTYRDFKKLCRQKGIKIEKTIFVGKSFLAKIFVFLGFKNWGAHSVMVRIKKAKK